MSIQTLLDEVSEPRKGGFFYGKSESSICPTFASSKIANSNSLVFSPETLYSWGSCGKILTALALTKMMEEGLISSSTTLNSIDPIVYSGTSPYFTGVSVLNTQLFPYFSNSYSYTTGTMKWSSLTVENLLQYNLGISNDVFFLPSLNLLYFNNTTRNIILQENSVEGLGMMVQFGIIYSKLVNGTPITPVTKIYNGENINNIAPTFVETYIQLTKEGIIPLLYNTNTYSDNRLPFRIRSLCATYDFSFLVLGDVMEKVLKKNGYLNFSDYVHQKIFNPLQMTDSYILFQDTVPVNKRARLSENSWRRAPALSLTVPLNPLNPATWPGCGCSPEYALIANPNAQTQPWGPLVWNSEFPNDGISYLSSVFYQTEKIDGCGFLGNSPFLSSIRDMGKLLECITNQGRYQLCPSRNFKNIINKTSWSYLMANKVLSSTYPSGAPYPLESVTPSSVSFSTGLTHENRDFSQQGLYGFDDSTFFKNGVTGGTLYVNTFTGVWMVYGFPEILLSSGYTLYPPPKVPSGSNLISSFVTALNH